MKRTKLSEFCDLKNGYAFKSKDYISESNTLLCRMSNIRPDGTFNIEYNKKCVPDEFCEIYKEYLLEDGDLIVAMTDMANDPKILGVPTIVDTNGYNVLLNQRVGKLIIKKQDLIDKRYLKYALSVPSLKSYYKKFAGGGLQINIGKKEILNIEIPIPSLTVQRKIVSTLQKTQEIIDKRKAQIEALDQLTQSVFLEMFGDPVLNPKEWPKLTMPSFVSKEKYSIKRGPFGGALKKEIFVNQGYLVYEQHHAINNDFSMARYFISEEKFDELKAFEVKPNDLIISCSGTLGKIAEVPENAPKGIINQALLKLTLDKNKMNNTFFIHLFRNQGIQNILFGTSHGSGIKNFPPMSVVKSIEFICPPIDEQKKFETKFKQITKKRERFELSLKEIENLYNALMQRAFKGELFTEEKVPNL